MNPSSSTSTLSSWRRCGAHAATSFVLEQRVHEGGMTINDTHSRWDHRGHQLMGHARELERLQRGRGAVQSGSLIEREREVTAFDGGEGADRYRHVLY